VTVLDASALLAFLQGEDGADLVEDGLLSGAACGTANWSEVAQKVRANGGDWPLARALLASYDLRLEVVTADDAEQAAAMWTRGSGLSLADRLCLALGRRLDVAVLTADRQWGEREPVRQIR
jgi:ribonuclease VapC